MERFPHSGLSRVCADETVNDLESLTTNLSRKIWQKITIIGQL